ncbi:VOC family protein [Parashewanella spongiae]|uniref:VOC family protein n=1 Tax=Parashewanella spongiae TaxID=342950 RepID=A0A3A6TKB0_9GAMM|nr:VOC family protein [Parashewanella spongiae]MCL1079083.1 VOC family protein [Parashewanella spongiae]RJY10696.1 VOC family protein [Parashewanella spongiae]
MNEHEKLNYVEFAAKDLSATKAFFIDTFDWAFTDYGPEYIAFAHEGLAGGFYQEDASSRPENGGALLVFYSDDIESTLAKVTEHGGEIVKPIFEFPGGCRFHFTEPSGNEFAVWSEADTTS